MIENSNQVLSNHNKEVKNTTKIEIENRLSNTELSLNKQKKVVLYTAADGKITANVFFAHENFWMTQKTMAELFGVNPPAISKHLKNIYESKELMEESTISKMEIVQIEGGWEITREVEVYNLDATN
jgi:3-dehydroquinate dehydratase